MKPTPPKFLRIFSLILITLTAMFFTVGCGSDDETPNNPGNPVITFTYGGTTTTAGLDGFGTSMPVVSPLVAGTNAYMEAEDGTRTLVTMSLILTNPSGKPTAGEYRLYKDGEQPDDGKPYASLLLTGATTAGLPSALEATAGTVKIESLIEHDFLLAIANYTFNATFHEIDETEDIAYQISGTIKHTNKLPAD